MLLALLQLKGGAALITLPDGRVLEFGDGAGAVSYTHLTLPTSDLV